MGDSTLYETDILAWSEQQAAVLRALKARRDLPSELDLENVAEEIEDAGRSQLQTVESLLVNMLVHLSLLSAEPGSQAANGWAAEIVAWNQTVSDRITPSMRQKLDLCRLWHNAARIAAAKLVGQLGERAVATLSTDACPYTLDDLIVDSLDPRALLASRPIVEISV